jgi:hypothetical protein
MRCNLMLTEPVFVTLQVVSVLDALDIPYFIGGSLASAVHGVIRSTLDVDLIAEMSPEHIEAFVRALEGDFYVDAEMIQDAIIHQSSFNLIHLETMFKVDIFISKDTAFERSQFARRVKQTLDGESGQTAYIASPEDIILAKLHWYRLGGEVSNRQWNDVLNICKVQGERLDRSYLETWADSLGVSDLLQRLMESKL